MIVYRITCIHISTHKRVPIITRITFKYKTITSSSYSQPFNRNISKNDNIMSPTHPIDSCLKSLHQRSLRSFMVYGRLRKCDLSLESELILTLRSSAFINLSITHLLSWRFNYGLSLNKQREIKKLSFNTKHSKIWYQTNIIFN